jgi:zinc transport system permease protein
VIVSVLALKDRLTLSIFSPDLAAATGVNVARIDLCFLLVFGLTVLIGLRFMGALLASALIIVPAATARQLTGNLWGFFLVSSGASVLSVLIGFLFNAFLVRSSTAGPAIVIVSAVLFALSLGIQKR